MSKQVNRKYKDGVFRTLFKDKERMLELYNAVSDSQYSPETANDIQVLTIENPLYLGIRNDLAFSLPGKSLFFAEHRSTVSSNMTIRMAAYFGETIQKIYGEEIYRSKRLDMNPPEFYVLYNGSAKGPTEQMFRLSEHFTGKPCENSMEVVVKFINICYNQEKEILKKSKTLREYSLLMSYIDLGVSEGLGREEAIGNAVKRAAEEGLLKEFLRRNGSEVIGMMHGEVTVERYGEIRWEEGYEDGGHDKCIEIAKKFKKLGASIEDIAEATGLTAEEVMALDDDGPV